MQKTFRRTAVALAVAGAFAIGVVSADRIAFHQASAAVATAPTPTSNVAPAPVAAFRKSAANLLVCTIREKACGALTRRRYGPRTGRGPTSIRVAPAGARLGLGESPNRGVDFASRTDLNANKPCGRATFQWHESICSVQPSFCCCGSGGCR